MSIISLDTTDSTNLEAKRRVETLQPYDCVTARLQTAGRGRGVDSSDASRDGRRIWTMSEGDLAASFWFLPNRKDFGAVSLVAGLAVADTLQSLGVANTACKWPNDIYVGGKKICGILCEAVVSESKIGIIIGIGINIVGTHDDLAPLDRPATSLRIELGPDYPRQPALLDRLAAYLRKRLDAWNTSGFGPMAQDWLNLCLHRNQEIRVIQLGRELKGWTSGIADDGQLLLKLPDGAVRAITSGDIERVII